MESKRLENIPGYDHPSKDSYSKSSMYKTFTEGQKPTKKEKFSTVSVGNQYASLNSLQDNTEQDHDFCPLCSKKCVEVCNCVYSDKICEEGHIWYISRSDGVVKVGNPHKNKNN